MSDNNALSAPAIGAAATTESQTSTTPEVEVGTSQLQPPDFDALSNYGWQWRGDANLTVDENYMDYAYLTARNSSCKEGHMGCVIVRGVAVGGGSAQSVLPVGTVVLRTINTPLFKVRTSDCHAEANAVAESARRGLAWRSPTTTTTTDATISDGSSGDAVSCGAMTCYVTRAPCAMCFKLIASAGVNRICSPRAMDSVDALAACARLGIESVAVTDSPRRATFRNDVGAAHTDMAAVRALREERKVSKRVAQEQKSKRRAANLAAAAAKKAIKDAAAAAKSDDGGAVNVGVDDGGGNDAKRRKVE
jgi:deoxycytidylate deaminase